MQNQIPNKFAVSKSSNLSFSKMPGGSFSGFDSSTYDLVQTNILSIERIKPETIKIDLKNSEGNIRTGYVRAKNKIGIQELNSIERCKKEFIGQSYDSFIYYQFESI